MKHYTKRKLARDCYDIQQEDGAGQFLQPRNLSRNTRTAKRTSTYPHKLKYEKVALTLSQRKKTILRER